MLSWLDRVPWIWLLLLAAWMAVAPITPECVFHAIADSHFTGSRTAFHDKADTVSR